MTPPRKGRNPRFKMDDYKHMRHLYREFGFSQKEIGHKYDVSQYYISRIVRGLAGNHGRREGVE